MALLVTGCTAQPVAGPPWAVARNATDLAWIQLMIPVTPPPPKGEDFSLCQWGFATDQPGP